MQYLLIVFNAEEDVLVRIKVVRVAIPYLIPEQAKLLLIDVIRPLNQINLGV